MASQGLMDISAGTDENGYVSQDTPSRRNDCSKKHMPWCDAKARLPSRRFQHIVGTGATPLNHFSYGRIHTEEF